MDQARVADPGGDQAGDQAQTGLAVQGLGQAGGGLGQETLPLLGALALADVVGDANQTYHSATVVSAWALGGKEGDRRAAHLSLLLGRARGAAVHQGAVGVAD